MSTEERLDIHGELWTLEMIIVIVWLLCREWITSFQYVLRITWTLEMIIISRGEKSFTVQC